MAEGKKTVANTVEFTVKKGERIPRKALGEYAEADNLSQAINRDGFLGTAMEHIQAFCTPSRLGQS